jgi:multiple sugar transport system ATP-binding protein
MASVKIENVSKHYGEFKAVNECNIEVTDGELLVLVGSSGCGKSTLLRMIAGLEEITAGTISIGDTIVNRIHPKDRNVAFVFQSYALYPHMTVSENIGFPLKNAGMGKSEIKTKVDDAAQLLGIVPLLHRKPSELSGGQRQRVALGRALVRRPEVFLLDEPLSNLDSKLRTNMRKEILLLHRKLGRTMIYVTHDQIEAMTLGDRICVMRDGVIQQMGKPLDIYHNPSNHFVAGFMGAAPINFLDGEILEEAQGPVFHAQNLKFPLNPAGRMETNIPNRAVIAGIRPEDIFLIEPGKPASMSAEIVFSEMLGDSQLVYLRSGNLDLTIKTDAKTRLVSGNKCGLGIRTENVHYFSKATGQNVIRI